MTDKEITPIEVGKYTNALSNLCGVEYPYMQGDPDVDAIAELIAVVVQKEDIINRQKAEIERLRGWENLLKAEKHSLIKAEAIKEFVERLKERAYISKNEWSHGEHPSVVDIEDVDDLLEEMVGEG